MQVLLPRSAKASSLIAGTALLLLTSPAIAGNDPTPNPGDTTWMLTSSLLVLMMSIPGLALFYGGLVRTKTCFLFFHKLLRLWRWWALSGRFTAIRLRLAMADH